MQTITRPKLLKAVLGLSILVGLPTAVHAQTFQGVGFPPGSTQTFALGLSADGTTVVGDWPDHKGFSLDSANQCSRSSTAASVAWDAI